MQLGDSPHDEALKHPRHQPPGWTASFSEHMPSWSSWSSSPSSTLPSPWWWSSSLQLPLSSSIFCRVFKHWMNMMSASVESDSLSAFMVSMQCPHSHYLQSINLNKIQRLSNANYIMCIYMYIYIYIYVCIKIYWNHVSVRWNLDHVCHTNNLQPPTAPPKASLFALGEVLPQGVQRTSARKSRNIFDYILYVYMYSI